MQGNRTKNILRWVVAIGATCLITYALVRGLTLPLAVNEMQFKMNGQSARNLFYHVPMWFAMMAMGYTSVVFSIIHLRKGTPESDLKAKVSAGLTVLFGALGLATGSVWSRVTWSQTLPATSVEAWWQWDPKQVGALVCVLLFAAYFLLRSSFDEPGQRGRISAVYNIFAAASIYPLFYLLPEVMESLHPGSKDEILPMKSMGGDFRSVFWPANLGFILLAVWLMDLRVRIGRVQLALQDIDA